MDREEIQVNRVDQLDCSLTFGSSDELISNIIEIRSTRDAGDAQRVSSESSLSLDERVDDSPVVLN
jgi:hypothetical protein